MKQGMLVHHELITIGLECDQSINCEISGDKFSLKNTRKGSIV